MPFAVHIAAVVVTLSDLSLSCSHGRTTTTHHFLPHRIHTVPLKGDVPSKPHTNHTPKPVLHKTEHHRKEHSECDTLPPNAMACARRGRRRAELAILGPPLPLRDRAELLQPGQVFLVELFVLPPVLKESEVTRRGLQRIAF